MKQQKIRIILTELRKMFGQHPKCELNYDSAWQLLVAIILSAQCTDKRVNAVTPVLFSKFPTVADIAAANLGELKNIIHSCGCFNTKAQNIQKTAEKIMANYNGAVPRQKSDLLNLFGVGEKTASVFLAEYYNQPELAVDTHVSRVSRRLGLTEQTDPAKIAADLKNLVPKNDWHDFHLLLVLFGRYHCTARSPKCADCPLSSLCAAKCV